MMLGMKGNQSLEERLHEVTEALFENVTAFSPGYTPGRVTTTALVYQLVPATKVRQGPMLRQLGQMSYLHGIACLHTGGAWKETLSSQHAKIIRRC